MTEMTLKKIQWKYSNLKGHHEIFYSNKYLTSILTLVDFIGFNDPLGTVNSPELCSKQSNKSALIDRNILSFSIQK